MDGWMVALIDKCAVHFLLLLLQVERADRSGVAVHHSLLVHSHALLGGQTQQGEGTLRPVGRNRQVLGSVSQSVGEGV